MWSHADRPDPSHANMHTTLSRNITAFCTQCEYTNGSYIYGRYVYTLLGNGVVSRQNARTGTYMVRDTGPIDSSECSCSCYDVCPFLLVQRCPMLNSHFPTSTSTFRFLINKPTPSPRADVSFCTTLLSASPHPNVFQQSIGRILRLRHWRAERGH